MSTSPNAAGEGFPLGIADAVKQAVESTLASVCGQKPLCDPGAPAGAPQSCIVGRIAFVGDPTWSLSLVLPLTLAPALAEKFAGFAIPADSPDMGDVVGELANVIGGDVRARLEAKRVKAQMSLPTVQRGDTPGVVEEQGLAATQMAFCAPEGRFWVGLATARPGQAVGRLPGN